MREEDLEAVRQVEAAAFSAWWKGLRPGDEDLPLRTRTNLLSCRAKDPEGCFVAEAGGRVVGFIFSRTWGGVGWFGTFAVLPGQQGQGIGKRLIAASLGYLQRDPSRVVGLETMPESPNNLGLYLKLGFQTRMLTLALSNRLERPAGDEVLLPRWSQADPGTQERWLAELRRASDQVCPGLDYSKEILVTSHCGQGDTLVLQRGGLAIGMATLWLSGSREGASDETGTLQVGFLQAGHTDTDSFGRLLQGCEALARSHGKERLVVPVNAQHTWALDCLLRRGYRVERCMVRMVLAGTDAGPSDDGRVDLGRWAG